MRSQTLPHPRDAAHGDIALVAHLRQVIIELHAEPCFRAAAERLGEAHRHFGRNAALAIDQLTQRHPCDAKRLSASGYAQTRA